MMGSPFIYSLRWLDQSVDKEAKRLGVPRQSLIKVLIAQHLDTH